jgi:hypothetical protein
MCQYSFYHATLIQQQMKKWHDKLIKKKQFKVSDWALLFCSKFKDFKGKFSTHWLGPYEIEIFFDNGSMKFETIDDEGISLVANGH